jgi:predicted ATP-grasp superfamily ATP-dependent carboligase
VKAWLAVDRQQLRELFEKSQEFVPKGEIMIQELIPGGSEQLFGFCSFFKGGRPAATMVTKYLRQHPLLFGRSCTAVKTVECPRVEDLGERFLSAINYYGLTEIEFKLDPRDGIYKLLDVNGRTWGYHSLGLAAGVDFPFLLFEDQCGRPVEPCRARPGITWIRMITDIPVGIMGVLRRQHSLSEYWKSVSAFDVEAVYSWKDPLPGLLETALLPYIVYKKGF